MQGLLVENASGLPGIDVNMMVEYLVLHMVAALRIGAFFIASPFFGARYVLLPVRILFTMVLAVILVPNIDIPDSQLIGTATGVMIIIKEISIGLAAGLIMTIWFSAAALAGEKIASTAGLGFAAQMDPASGAQTPVVSQILNLLLVVLFLSLDAHLLVISIILKSYEISPIAYSADLSVLVVSGIEAAGMMFFAAAMIMLPVITLLLMINLTIGVVTRSAPTLNLFSFGFPISMLGVFFILYISTDVLGYALSDLIEAAVDSIERSIAGIAYG